MRISGIVVAGVLTGTLIAGSAAAEAGPINRREHRQIARIIHGVRSGALTKRETARLMAEQARIRLMEQRFRRSGHGLSAWEYARLQRVLNRSSQHIYKQTHDRQRRRG
jgi:hypothetical protein